MNHIQEQHASWFIQADSNQADLPTDDRISLDTENEITRFYMQTYTSKYCTT